MLTQVVSGRVYDYSHGIGGRAMMKPYGMAIGSGDIIYVSDRRYSSLAQIRAGGPILTHIKKIDLGNEAGEEELLIEFANTGTGEGELIWPSGMACDAGDKLYIAEEWLNHIVVFGRGGDFLGTWGETGDSEGQLNRPSGINFDDAGDLYIVDSMNHRVQKFTADGVFLGAWGSKGIGAGQFNAPWGITIDVGGNVYVADCGNHRVQKFTRNGDFVFEFGRLGSQPGKFNHPSDVAVDPDGDIYVCDWGNSRIQAFDAEGTILTTFIGDAVQLAKWQQQFVDANEAEQRARRRVPSLEQEWRFALPMSVEFHSRKGWMMVADTQRGRLQVYAKLKDYIEPQFNL